MKILNNGKIYVEQGEVFKADLMSGETEVFCVKQQIRKNELRPICECVFSDDKEEDSICLQMACNSWMRADKTDVEFRYVKSD